MTSVHDYDIDVQTVLKTVPKPNNEHLGRMLYRRPWSRWPPYVVGMLLGLAFFMITKRKRTIRIPQVRKNLRLKRIVPKNRENPTDRVTTFA